MWSSIDIRVFRMHFETRSFNNEKSTSAKAKGYIDLYLDFSTKILYVPHWEIKFESLYLDLYTTPAWFKSRKKNFNLRKSLFDKLGLRQTNRPDKTENRLYELDQNELEIANKWFNEEYNSTLKNIISIIKGNNAGGSFKKPSAAEMIGVNLYNKYEEYKYNLTMFFDLITYKDKRILDLLENDENSMLIDKLESINDFLDYIVNSNKYPIHSNLLKLTTVKLNLSYEERKKFFVSKSAKIMDMEETIRDSNKKLSEIDKKIKRARSKASKMKINVFKREKGYSYENAHILDVAIIRNKLIELIDENKQLDDAEFLNLFDYITDENNMLNLQTQVHKWFDKGFFSFNKNGEITKTKNDFDINEYNELCFYKTIPKDKLTDERINYINLRNENRGLKID